MSADFGPIIPRARIFSHRDASKVYNAAIQASLMDLVEIDLRHVEEATTSAFARLVLLRRELLRRGRDLRITGLQSRTAHLYELNRLESILPRA